MSAATLTVDLGALSANYATLVRAAAPGVCGAVVKANAYGLGAPAVVARLSTLGCRTFFVASAAEGREVRATAPQADIYVFASTGHDSSLLIDHHLIPVVNDIGQLERWRVHRDRPIALHVDSGMNRLGFEPGVLAGLDLSSFRVSLLMTHLACADLPDHPANATQRAAFLAVTKRFPGIATSVCNSAALLSGGGDTDEICRPGIALYGANPFVERSSDLKVVARFEAEVLQTKRVKAGSSVGYGATWVAPGTRTIAVIAAGYADGVPRLLSNRGAVGFGDERLPIVGRVSMDTTTVDATAVSGRLRPGERVTFFGGPVRLEEVATWAETLSYEVLTGVGPRVERRYVG